LTPWGGADYRRIDLARGLMFGGNIANALTAVGGTTSGGVGRYDTHPRGAPSSQFEISAASAAHFAFVIEELNISFCVRLALIAEVDFAGATISKHIGPSQRPDGQVRRLGLLAVPCVGSDMEHRLRSLLAVAWQTCATYGELARRESTYRRTLLR
jgi:hypothetical protein